MTIISFGGSNLLRLISNLILTRLLFPEAFGLMALVQVFMTGLQMFSDIGLRTSVIQNSRGDEPDFLNTVWTIQIIRGVILWLAACVIAFPAATLYDEPVLALLIPVVGLDAIITGFHSTNIATANRHLSLGRLSVISLGTQAIGILAMVALAWLTGSVWALAIGSMASSLSKLVLSHTVLPGIRNRFRWEMDSVRSVFGFGQFIFISTVAGFLVAQGDRAILGKFVSLEELAVFSIGFMLATVPFSLTNSLVTTILIPLYRVKLTDAENGNRRKISSTRFLLSGGSFALTMPLAVVGNWLVHVLYDDRYVLAGPVLVATALSRLPMITVASYNAVLLAAGDSKAFMKNILATAAFQTVFLFVGVMQFGLMGAILAPALAAIAVHPYVIWQLRPYKGWDRRHDLTYFSISVVFTGAMYFFHGKGLFAALLL